jgi:hypothetical protein
VALALDADRPSLRNNLAIALRMSGSSRAEEIAALRCGRRSGRGPEGRLARRRGLLVC